MDSIALLTEAYKSYFTEIGEKDGFAVFTIINPFWDGNIEVHIDSDDISGEGIIFYFPLHHAHFDEDFDSLIEYINDFLQGERFAVALYQDDNLILGCSYRGEIDTSSGESIVKSLAGDGPLYPGSNTTAYESLQKQLEGRHGRCSIRGWNNALNQDIEFTML